MTVDTINKDPIVIIGRFGAPFGIKGWLKVHSFTRPSDNLPHYQPWQVQLKGHWSPVDVLEVREHSTHFIASIKGLTSPEAAITYRNADIGIYHHQLPTLAPDEIYWSDLENLTVLTITGVTVGRVDSVFATGSNDVLVVKTEQNKEILIPYLRNTVIKEIDVQKGTLLVDWDLE